MSEEGNKGGEVGEDIEVGFEVSRSQLFSYPNFGGHCSLKVMGVCGW